MEEPRMCGNMCMDVFRIYVYINMYVATIISICRFFVFLRVKYNGTTVCICAMFNYRQSTQPGQI